MSTATLTRGHVLLRDYLRRYDLSPRQFAEMLDDARSHPDDYQRPNRSGAPYGTVRRLLKGSMPQRGTRLTIAVATAGEIPAEAWEETE